MTRRPAALITIRICIVDQFVRGNWADLRARLIHVRPYQGSPKLTQRTPRGRAARLRWRIRWGASGVEYAQVAPGNGARRN